MPKYTRGVEPVAFYIGSTPVLRKYLGDKLIWDGTRSVVAQALRARATAVVLPAAGSASAAATATTATANAAARGATAATSSEGQATAATATAAVAAATGSASSHAATTPATATAQVLDAVGADVGGDAPANAVAATAAAAVLDATGSADSTAVATPAAAAAGAGVAIGGVSMIGAAVPAAATAEVRAAAGAASAAATATVATAGAAGKPAVGSSGATAAATPATATATAKNATGTAINAVSYSDNYNRAALGANWVGFDSFLPVINNSVKAQAGSNGPNNAGTVYAARWVDPVFSNDQEVSCVVVTPGGTASLGLGGGVFLRGTATGDRVEALLTDSAAYIFTRIGGTATVRAQQTGLGIGTGLALRFTASPTGVYSIYLAGGLTVSWTDTTAIIPINTTTHYTGIVTVGSKTSLGAASYGWAIDNWVGKDAAA